MQYRRSEATDIGLNSKKGGLYFLSVNFSSLKKEKGALRLDLLSSVLPVLLLSTNLCLLGTFHIYASNSGEFVASFQEMLVSGLVSLWLILTLILLVPVLLLKNPWGQTLRLTFLFLGVVTYTHGNLLVWDVGVLDGTPLDFTKSGRNLVDLAIWLVAAAIFLKWRQVLLRQGWQVAILLLVLQAAGAIQLQWTKPASRIDGSDTLPPELPIVSSQGNVFHLVLDGFQASIFESLLERENRLGADLPGFTFFRDSTTSSPVTYLSIPASLTGVPYRFDTTISHYHEQALNGQNIYSELAEKGYSIDIATPVWWNPPRSFYSSYFRVPAPYSFGSEATRTSVAKLLDVSLFRQTPHFLKPLVYRSGNWWLSSLLNGAGTQFEHFAHNSFLLDLTDQLTVIDGSPRYKFIHLVTPHAPLVTREDCSFIGHEVEYTFENTAAQSLCTLENSLNFVRRLMELGVYDESLILIHSDHGGGVGFDLKTSDGNTVDSSKALDRLWGNPLPLLLIKPPYAQGRLHISDTWAELSDIPATILDLLGLEPNFPGTRLFAEGSSKNRSRYFYNSLIHRNDAAAKDRFDQFTEYEIRGSVYDLTAWDIRSEHEVNPLNDREKYIFGTRLSFGTEGTFRAFIESGWAMSTDKAITWTNGKAASLLIPFEKTQTDILLSARVKPFLAPGLIDSQRVTVRVGGSEISRFSLEKGEFQMIEVEIPAGLLMADGSTRISVELPDAISPSQLNVSPDRRMLGLAFYELQFEAR